MDRPLRRQDRAITADDAAGLLANGTYGVLSSVGEDGQPYATPLSYVFDGTAIYFHCAREGHKLDNIRTHPAVSFCVVGHTRTLPAQFATEYESAIVFGQASEVFDDEKNKALVALLEKYSPDFLPQGRKYIAGKTAETVVIKIAIDRLTGKARR